MAVTEDGKTLTAGSAPNGASTDDVVVQVHAGCMSYTEGDDPTVIVDSVTLTDPDSSNMEGATIQIAHNYLNDQDVLGIDSCHL